MNMLKGLFVYTTIISALLDKDYLNISRLNISCKSSEIRDLCQIETKSYMQEIIK